VKDCRLLGAFKLGGIPPMPAQMAQVDVTFRIDANGMLKVSAKEQRSGQQASVEVKAAHGLSQDEVDRLVLESVDHAHADFNARRFIELKNKADADLRHTEKALAQSGNDLTAEQSTALTAAKTELIAAMQSSDVDRLQRAVDAFGTVTTPLAELLMNATATKMLSGQREDEIDPDK
jgi:molecular chaperone DnaK